ncbi:MAG TPA: group 1 truncated hemoglobin [Kofleriaceae bacterium]|nr:group 1 truncated hemoglobin [Kofleriaceae bacterium]
MKRLVVVLALFGVVLAFGLACGGKPHRASTAAHPSGPVLYDRIGRMDAIKGIVKDFVEEQLKKGTLAGRFSNVDTAQLEDNLARQLCELTGGPCKYTGRTMHEAHASLAITSADFTAFVAAFEQSLVKFKVEPQEQNELLALYRKQHDDIVTQPQ